MVRKLFPRPRSFASASTGARRLPRSPEPARLPINRRCCWRRSMKPRALVSEFFIIGGGARERASPYCGVLAIMNKLLWKYVAVLAMFPYCLLAQTPAPAQTPLTWEQVRQRFEQSNPTLRAGQIGIDESKAQEITAYLRPNPSFNVTVDGTQLVPYNGVHRPLAGTY